MKNVLVVCLKKKQGLIFLNYFLILNNILLGTIVTSFLFNYDLILIV